MYDSHESYLNQIQECQEIHKSKLEQSYEQDSDEQTDGKEAHQQNSLHQCHSRAQTPPIEPDTCPRIFNRRLSTQDEDILLFAGQNPRKDDWPDISTAYSQKHGYRSPEACRKRYYILEPRNREYTKRRNVPSQGRRPRQTGATQMAAVTGHAETGNGIPLPLSAATRSTTQHALPVEQQFLPVELAACNYQSLQPVTYTATTTTASATATFNGTNLSGRTDNSTCLFARFTGTAPVSAISPDAPCDRDQSQISEEWAQGYRYHMQNATKWIQYEDGVNG